MFLFQVSVIRSEKFTEVPFEGNFAITVLNPKVTFLYCSFHLRDPIFKRLYFSFNSLKKAASYSEKFVLLTGLRSGKSEQILILLKLLLNCNNVPKWGDIQWCWNSTERQ
jgi:hypothetical protein